MLQTPDPGRGLLLCPSALSHLVNLLLAHKRYLVKEMKYKAGRSGGLLGKSPYWSGPLKSPHLLPPFSIQLIAWTLGPGAPGRAHSECKMTMTPGPTHLDRRVTLITHEDDFNAVELCIFYHYSKCIHNIKFATLTVFRCAVQWH